MKLVIDTKTSCNVYHDVYMILLEDKILKVFCSNFNIYRIDRKTIDDFQIYETE